ncbi:D-ornithine/D-lysine decarboxylase [Trichinella pseudospiralis]
MEQKTKSSFTAPTCKIFVGAARVINGGKRVSLANVHYQVRICLRTLANQVFNQSYQSLKQAESFSQP